MAVNFDRSGLCYVNPVDATQHALQTYLATAGAKPDAPDAKGGSNAVSALRGAERDLLDSVRQGLFKYYRQDVNQNATIEQMEGDQDGMRTAEDDLIGHLDVNALGPKQVDDGMNAIDYATKTLSVEHDVAQAELKASPKDPNSAAATSAGLGALIGTYDSLDTGLLPDDAGAFLSQSPVVQDLLARAQSVGCATSPQLRSLQTTMANIASFADENAAGIEKERADGGISTSSLLSPVMREALQGSYVDLGEALGQFTPENWRQGAQAFDRMVGGSDSIAGVKPPASESV
ncbi:hypothetical protein [Trinickia sp.]|uniref:hypothetical protein n=1 Tax=Trinickia sp. TaxID=2571163 RepID=UPI003F815303